jgi:hypothetical protein
MPGPGDTPSIMANGIMVGALKEQHADHLVVIDGTHIPLADGLLTVERFGPETSLTSRTRVTVPAKSWLRASSAPKIRASPAWCGHAREIEGGPSPSGDCRARAVCTRVGRAYRGPPAGQDEQDGRQNQAEPHGDGLDELVAAGLGLWSRRIGHYVTGVHATRVRVETIQTRLSSSRAATAST